MLTLKTSFHILLVVINATLNLTPIKKFMQFWQTIIACRQLTSFHSNYMANRFVPVVRQRVLDVVLPVRIFWLCESILVEPLVYFLGLHPRFASLFQSSFLSICQASLLHESILVESFFQFLGPHPRFASLFQSSLLSFF